jgi:hypothetical protein
VRSGVLFAFYLCASQLAPHPPPSTDYVQVPIPTVLDRHGRVPISSLANEWRLLVEMPLDSPCVTDWARVNAGAAHRRVTCTGHSASTSSRTSSMRALATHTPPLRPTAPRCSTSRPRSTRSSRRPRSTSMPCSTATRASACRLTSAFKSSCCVPPRAGDGAPTSPRSSANTPAYLTQFGASPPPPAPPCTCSLTRHS